QKLVMEAIFGSRGVKAGTTGGAPRRTILSIARKLVRRGAQAVIAGCTEVPLVLRADDLSVPYVEPMLIAARLSISRAGYPLID
ncbi:MAG: aspartate racemase, partial [Candidatus Aminicenantes bacterium]|nr:aspartate racemase [Candidatus Aminicenantes bacterium]